MIYLVRRYYSGFCTNAVEAESRPEALEKARQLQTDYDEVLSTIEDWEEADEVEFHGETN
jgi:hypothetical protein